MQLSPRLSFAGRDDERLVAIKLIRRPIPRVVAPNILREIRVRCPLQLLLALERCDGLRSAMQRL